MKLASLKQSYKEWTGEKPVGAERDEYYPTLYLDEKALDSMGLDAVKAGAEMTMVSTVRVSSVSDNANGSRSVTFEIIEAAVEPKAEQRDASSILFPNG